LACRDSTNRAGAERDEDANLGQLSHGCPLSVPSRKFRNKTAPEALLIRREGDECSSAVATPEGKGLDIAADQGTAHHADAAE
jgi:hypothetical protein